MSTSQLKLWNDTQPTLLINSGKLLKKSSIRKKESENILSGTSRMRFYIYSPQLRWVLLLGQWALKPYGLVKQNIFVPIQQIISRYDFILEMLLRSDDEHRANALNPVQSGKVVISFVKDIERIRLIWYLIHCLHIVKFRFCNVNLCRNLSDYIKQCMHFDSALGLSEVCPLEKTHTK